MASITTKLLSLAATISALSAQGFVVVPAAYATNDASAYEWIAGATDEQRQQTLIGASHLPASMLNRPIVAIEMRRSVFADAFVAGSVNLTVTLSISPSNPLTPSNVFATNVGSNPQQVFQGTVAIPASPATGPTQTTVAWTSNNTVRIDLTTPFVYTGGTLCVDITGAPITGQTTWWMADAVEEVIPGTSAVDIGAGCGIYGGPQRRWSTVHARSLAPGGQGVFRAEGTPFGIGLAMFGLPSTATTQLPFIGPGCSTNLDMATGIITALPALFEPEVHPDLQGVATAEVLFAVPASGSLFGIGLATQWFDWPQWAVSNTIDWKIGSAISSLDMALIEGHPLDATGNVTNYLAHVMRFEVQ
jgi:hypothetical protein